jgi:hypothetical protein
MSQKIKDETEKPPLKNPRFVSSSKAKDRESIKKQKLAEALRENLKKRKEQIRERNKSTQPK